MAQQMDGTQVRKGRLQENLTVAAAAAKAKIGAATWKRIEAGKSRRRETVWKGVCYALGVEPEDIRVGGKGVAARHAATLPKPEPQALGTSVQINARISPEARNALALVAHRYGCTQTAIIEAAPIFFLILAEESLRERRLKLAEMRAHLDQQEDFARTYLRHLDVNVYPRGAAHDALYAEEKSVEKRDLFAADINALIDKDALSWAGIHRDDDEASNPMAAFLQRKAEGIADYVSFTEQGASYSLSGMFMELLGPGDAAYFAAKGSTPFHALPKALLAPGKEEEARAWLMEKCDPDAVRIEREVDAALNAKLGGGDKP